MTWGHWYWPLAIILVSVVAGASFFPAETLAFFTNHQNTLSDFLRSEFDVTTASGSQTKMHTWAWWVSLITWSAFTTSFLVWFTGHIWFDTWG